MQTNWRDKTCEKCEYNIDTECRRFPIQISYPVVTMYPYVKDWTKYYKACAEFKPKEKDNTE